MRIICTLTPGSHLHIHTWAPPAPSHLGTTCTFKSGNHLHLQTWETPVPSNLGNTCTFKPENHLHFYTWEPPAPSHLGTTCCALVQMLLIFDPTMVNRRVKNGELPMKPQRGTRLFRVEKGKAQKDSCHLSVSPLPQATFSSHYIRELSKRHSFNSCLMPVFKSQPGH